MTLSVEDKLLESLFFLVVDDPLWTVGLDVSLTVAVEAHLLSSP